MFTNLEEIEGVEALAFAQKESLKALTKLSAQPLFNTLKEEIHPILSSPDQLLWVYRRGKYAYNFWTDDKNEKGLWRRCSFEDYLKHTHQWEVILDIDELCAKEGENWVWGGSTFLRDDYSRALISLSKGGKDAAEEREFDLDKKEFVKDGFFIPEEKNVVTWKDKNTLLIGTNWGEESLTDSGYPRIIKELKRGQDLSQAKTVFETNAHHLSAGALINKTDQGNQVFYVDTKSFYETIILNENLKPIPMPVSASIIEVFKDREFIYLLKEDLVTPNKTFICGSLVSFSIDDFNNDLVLENLKLVFQPTDSCFFDDLGATEDSLVLNLMDNVQGKLVTATLSNNKWTLEDLYNSVGSVSLAETDEHSNTILISETGFLLPTTIYSLDVRSKNKTFLQQQTPQFDASSMTASQKWVKSKDGTLIPYFIVHKKDLPLDGKNPTLLYGYGGFEDSQEPGYLGITGKVWLERGGVYVLSNIRGGGEFGPRWHQAGLKENRHKVFEDFIAIAEDLVSSKITSPDHLGIEGGSNGGLLVSACATMRPELFKAVICKVPLTDMLNYHTMLAGASWMDEYGNPDEPSERAVLESYSPLHQLKENVQYPEMFVFTSTKDDRVHPAHARKLVARLKELNQEVFYFENINGGHGGSADLSEETQNLAMDYSYLFMKLSA